MFLYEYRHRDFERSTLLVTGQFHQPMIVVVLSFRSQILRPVQFVSLILAWALETRPLLGNSFSGMSIALFRNMSHIHTTVICWIMLNAYVSVNLAELNSSDMEPGALLSSLSS